MRRASRAKPLISPFLSSSSLPPPPPLFLLSSFSLPPPFPTHHTDRQACPPTHPGTREAQAKSEVLLSANAHTQLNPRHGRDQHSEAACAASSNIAKLNKKSNPYSALSFSREVSPSAKREYRCRKAKPGQFVLYHKMLRWPYQRSWVQSPV